MDHPTLVRELEKHPLVRTASELLQTKLPATLKYHTHAHTMDVMSETVLFGHRDGLSPRELELLAIGAAYHDTGFIVAGKDNEVFSADLAAKNMTDKGGYSPDEIAAVTTMIHDSQLKFIEGIARQISTSKLSNYLLDGDLSNFGRADFFKKALLVREEYCREGDPTFYPDLLNMLLAHQWNTLGAAQLRDEGKQKNLKALKVGIAQGTLK